MPLCPDLHLSEQFGREYSSRAAGRASRKRHMAWSSRVGLRPTDPRIPSCVPGRWPRWLPTWGRPSGTKPSARRWRLPGLRDTRGSPVPALASLVHPPFLSHALLGDSLGRHKPSSTPGPVSALAALTRRLEDLDRTSPSRGAGGTVDLRGTRLGPVPGLVGWPPAASPAAARGRPGPSESKSTHSKRAGRCWTPAARPLCWPAAVEPPPAIVTKYSGPGAGCAGTGLGDPGTRHQ